MIVIESRLHNGDLGVSGFYKEAGMNSIMISASGTKDEVMTAVTEAMNGAAEVKDDKGVVTKPAVAAATVAYKSLVKDLIFALVSAAPDNVRVNCNGTDNSFHMSVERV